MKLLDYYIQGQSFFSTFLLTVIFGAFALLDLMNTMHGATKTIIFVYYVLVAIGAGYPATAWITRIRLVGSLMDSLGIFELPEAHAPKTVLSLRIYNWKIFKIEWVSSVVWLVVSILMFILGVAVYFG